MFTSINTRLLFEAVANPYKYLSYVVSHGGWRNAVCGQTSLSPFYCFMDLFLRSERAVALQSTKKQLPAGAVLLADKAEPEQPNPECIFLIDSFLSMRRSVFLSQSYGVYCKSKLNIGGDGLRV